MTKENSESGLSIGLAMQPDYADVDLNECKEIIKQGILITETLKGKGGEEVE